MNPKPPQVYVLRIWYEPSPEGEVWRASVSQGEERHYFAELQELARFLQGQFPEQTPTLHLEDVS
ncbi:hypothetical protein [Meiothermus taiwanensis]|uniref:Uncharacterized protein n=1 Tax=Meiothermus taiwanensis TaxID=172827 RepID=A0A399E5E5_9DEIN|nr:hypothetical protein [Meiothermus taiwanensis]KIQ55145.1 hypothetical protein SY28_04905 [Meiothermus taiwanensis]KZK15668.1 hypothetical protein A3962_09145 [Meiothermus taiwanensis]RIH79148.1 hypothetical protein Mcate_00499 [Meiothermus taiwanensis]